jgi:hypothetical protein
MRAFWADSFLHPTAPHFRQEFAKAIYVLLGVGNFSSVRLLILIALFGIGAYGVLRSRGVPGLVLAVGPFVAVLAAAAVQAYPIAERLSLFLSPFLFWIYASGAAIVAGWLPQKARTAGVIGLSLALFAPTGIASVQYAWRFPMREATRQLVARMKSTDRDAPTYLVFGKYQQWAYYTGDWSYPETLKRRIDSVDTSRCVQLIELGAVIKPDECAKKIEGGTVNMPGEIVGTPPPGSSEGVQTELLWAGSEAQRIIAETTAEHKDRFWLFLPIYNENAKQRGLLEKLTNALEGDGAGRLDTFSLGDSVALRYRIQGNGPRAMSGRVVDPADPSSVRN